MGLYLSRAREEEGGRELMDVVPMLVRVGFRRGKVSNESGEARLRARHGGREDLIGTMQLEH